MCNKGCGVDLGIGWHLLGTTKEWMILSKVTCSKCRVNTEKRCAVEGCDKLPQTGCNGYCAAHAEQEQLDAKKRRKKEKRKEV
jgi:hypothetical protein